MCKIVSFGVHIHMCMFIQNVYVIVILYLFALFYTRNQPFVCNSCTPLHTHTHTHIHTNTHTYIHIHTQMYKHKYTHTDTGTCLQTHTLSSTHMHIYTHIIHLHTHNAQNLLYVCKLLYENCVFDLL